MFLNGSFYHVSQDTALHHLFTPQKLTETVNLWVERKNFVEKKGIRFYKAFWPEKHTIYDEFLPWYMSVVVADTLLQLDQVLDYLKKRKLDLQIIDVTKTFKQEKKHKRLYFKHDSHWNSEGAFIAYTRLMNVISRDFPALKPRPATDFEITYVEKSGGDLSNIIGIGKTETVPVYKLKNDSSQVRELPFFDYPPGTFWIFENKKSNT